MYLPICSYKDTSLWVGPFFQYAGNGSIDWHLSCQPVFDSSTSKREGRPHRLTLVMVIPPLENLIVYA
jgi:hypothetical protein